jgi:uncharacterized protein (TIGR01619 family)
MSIKNVAPVKDMPFLLATGIGFDQCNTDGLPEKEAFPQLYKVSDALKLFMDNNLQNIFTGTFTYQCERQDHYYIKDTVGLREKLNKFYTDSFPGSKYRINIKTDNIWQDYIDFLYPNAVSLEFIANEKVISKLKEAGDQPEKERLVDHWLYFKTETDQACFIPYAIKQKFKIVSKEKTSDANRPYKLHIARTDKVELSAISAITIDLKRVAMRCNGAYDGWETAVVK